MAKVVSQSDLELLIYILLLILLFRATSGHDLNYIKDYVNIVKGSSNSIKIKGYFNNEYG